MTILRTLSSNKIYTGLPLSQFIFLLLLLLSCRSTRTQPAMHYSLTGLAVPGADGTKLYLRDVVTNAIFDSTEVTDGRFFFTGTLPDVPAHFYLHSPDYALSKGGLWLEDTDMILDAGLGDFGQATLRGSKTQEEAEILYARLATTEDYDEQIELALQFIAEYPDNRVSAAVLAGYSQNVGKARVRELYNALSVPNQTSVYGERIRKYLEINVDHAVGDPYTDFQMSDPDGNTVKFSDHLGTVTLLEFWASWCGPCRKSNPELVELYREFYDRGFRIVSVSLDFSREEWMKAIFNDHLSWTHVSDLKGRNSTAGIIYGINTIPDNFLIDSKGKIVANYLWGEELREQLKSLLSNKE
ncbi:MAG: TlpA disulfide reductase family protein [Saprospiraceae bacterium]|nr:AhpC/TSA family protein [Lewinella sp.]